MQLWQLLGDKFVKLSQREKWLITLCGFVAIVMALMTFVIEPLYQSNQKVM
ncbi:MSHA biogenesis protein MshJ, partial [Vibrio xuii]